MTRALLWDHDGVLVDTEGLYFAATREVLATLGIDLSEELYRQHFLVQGTGVWQIASERGVPEDMIAQLRQRRNARYDELLQRSEVLSPYALPLLASLSQRFRMCIVTSSHGDHFQTIHRTTGLTQYFEFILTREDYVHSKPNPEPYLTAVARLGLAKTDCLVIEDSERGLAAAMAAGLRCWVVPSALTKGSRFEAADRQFESLQSLHEALSALA